MYFFFTVVSILSFFVGIVFADFFMNFYVFLFILVFFLCVFYFFRNVLILFIVLFFVFGVGRYEVAMWHFGDNDVSGFVDLGNKVLVGGEVCSDPYVHNDAFYFELCSKFIEIDGNRYEF